MGRDALIEKLARGEHAFGQGLESLRQPWEALSESRKDYYLRNALAVLPVIVDCVATWLHRYGNGWPEDDEEHYQGEGHALTRGETEDLVAAWREAMQP